MLVCVCQLARVTGLTQTSKREVWVKRTILFFKAILRRFVFETRVQFAKLSGDIVNSNPQDTRWAVFGKDPGLLDTNCKR
jgi:hypothetical protein